MTTKKRILPFGNLSTDIGRQRLFTIGIAIGLILGLMVDAGWLKIVLGLLAVTTIVVRTAAQYRYPDRPPQKRG